MHLWEVISPYVPYVIARLIELEYNNVERTDSFGLALRLAFLDKAQHYIRSSYFVDR